MVESPATPTDWKLQDKISSYPTVSYTVDVAVSAYEATKEYNSVTKMTSGLVETTASTIYGMSKPVLNVIEPQLKSLDNYAAGTLDALDEKVPIVKEDPSKIYESAKEATVATVNNSYVGKAVSYAMLPVVTAAESLVAGKSSCEEDEKKVEAADGPNGDAESSLESGQSISSTSAANNEYTLRQTIIRAYTVGGKIQRKALDKALDQVNGLVKVTHETLNNLSQAVDLVQYARSVENTTPAVQVRAFVTDLLQDDTGKLSDAQETENKREKYEKITIVVTRNLTKKFGKAYDSLVDYTAPYMTVSISKKLAEARVSIDYLEQTFTEANSMNDLTSACILKTRENIDNLRQTLADFTLETLEAVARSRPASWVMSAENGSRVLAEVRRRFSTSGTTTSTGSTYSPQSSLDEDFEPSDQSPPQEGDEGSEKNANQSQESNDENTE